jgi:hypothetical protein
LQGPVRIALYSRGFPPAKGGMERFAEELAGWVAAQGHEMTVLTWTSADPEADLRLPYRVLRGARSWDAWAAVRRADVAHISGLLVRGSE